MLNLLVLLALGAATPADRAGDALERAVGEVAISGAGEPDKSLYGKPHQAGYFGLCQADMAQVRTVEAGPESGRTTAAPRFAVVGALKGDNWSDEYEMNLEQECAALGTSRGFFTASSSHAAYRGARALQAVATAARSGGDIPFPMVCPVEHRQACADWRELARVTTSDLVTLEEHPCGFAEPETSRSWMCTRLLLVLRDPKHPDSEYGSTFRWILKIELETASYLEMDGAATRRVDGFSIRSVAPEHQRHDH